MKQAIQEDLSIMPGTGAYLSVGSDCYALYVVEILDDGIIGMYSPKTWFDKKHPWHNGTHVVDDFKHNAKSEFYIKRRYGNWWKVSRDGRPLSRYTTKHLRLHFGKAYSYRDPSVLFAKIQ